MLSEVAPCLNECCVCMERRRSGALGNEGNLEVRITVKVE